MPVSRRDFIQSAAALIIGSACSPRESGSQSPTATNEAMLTVKFANPSQKPTIGLQQLGLSSGSRDGFIYVPATYSAAKPSPLLVLLHGAGQNAKEFTRGQLSEIFDTDRIVVLFPDSRMPTWDMIYTGDYGPDVRFMDKALALAFSRCRIDPKKIALGGFSDGATYALSLGITNANFFSTVLAFSPGFVKPAVKTGKPRIFIGHGTGDEILPIEMTSREIVAALKEKNYPVKFEEFEGGHTMTREEVAHAVDFFLQR